VSEPNFTDQEKRILREMIHSYQNAKVVDAWFATKRKALLITVGALSSICVLSASLIEIGRTFL
jgi:hypothetical protein